MKHPRLFKSALLAAGCLALMPLWVSANPAQESIAKIQEQKPFAKEHIALQITDADPARQQIVLNVARNLLKHFGPDQLDLEVVGFGPGLQLLLRDNPLAPQVEALAADGVRFSACQNSMKALAKTLGHEPELNPAARTTPAGIVRLYELSKAGYFIDRP